jgi:hypothetical protein
MEQETEQWVRVRVRVRVREQDQRPSSQREGGKEGSDILRGVSVCLSEQQQKRESKTL